MFAKWEDRAVWTPFLHPTVNINHFMSDGASPTARRTIIPRTAHARLDIRVTPDTPPAAMEEIVTRVVAEHRDRTPGITFTARFASQPASYTSPTRPEFGWLLRLLEQHGDAEPVALPTLGGTLPLWIPAANSDNQQHDVNEHFVLRHFFQQTALYADVVGSRPA
jgi:acetylornithine deacetylase/succinyl-diaminopimelate desuccinylase-like protein